MNFVLYHPPLESRPGKQKDQIIKQALHWAKENSNDGGLCDLDKLDEHMNELVKRVLNPKMD